MIELRQIKEIPKEISNNFKPCWKCGKKPIIKEYSKFEYGTSMNWIAICCPNENCHNVVYPIGYTININSDDIKEWNNQNIEKYVPKSKEIKEVEKNCKHCKYVMSCIYVREKRIGQFIDSHVCNDFEKKSC